MRTVFLGDIHGDFSVLNKIEANLIIQVGDFGYWPKSQDAKKKITTKVPVWFVDGNHEDHWALKEELVLPETVKYIPRMTVKEINGLNALFVGGALSIDKHLRTLGKDWFPEEQLTPNEVLKEVPRIDMVVSHTGPTEFVEQLGLSYLIPDQSTECLSYILKEHTPKYWIFGHFHLSARGFTKNCKWQCIDCNQTLDFECLISG